VGAEDCLYLNVYVPVREKMENKIPMPVLFWIHGGAFQFGSGMFYKPKYLMDHDVIFVTINYRLGPMGMCLHYIFIDKTKSMLFKIIFPVLKFI